MYSPRELMERKALPSASAGSLPLELSSFLATRFIRECHVLRSVAEKGMDPSRDLWSSGLKSQSRY